MNDNTKKTVKNILLTGSIVAGSVIGLSGLNANATETFKYSELGSGAEVRTELLQSSSSDIRMIDMSCGEDHKEAKKEKKEGKEKKDKKAETKEAKASKESKSTEHKCGEGACGESSKKEDKKAAKESKSKEAKCGESNFAG